MRPYVGRGLKAEARIAAVLLSYESRMRLHSLLTAAALALAVSPCLAAEPALVRANLVKDINTAPGQWSSQPSLFKTLASRVYFAATAPRTGQELYSTDAQGGLRFLGDIAPGARGSLPEPVAVVGGKLIATADDGLTGRQLWALPVDGGLPQRLTSMSFNWSTPPGTAELVATIGNRALMYVRTQGYGLWSSDGTVEGTYYRSTASGFPLDVVQSGCALQDAAILFGGGSAQSLLVRSTGVPGGDSVIATLPPEVWARGSVNAGGVCYFLLASSSGPARWYLWRSDGTSQGSVQLASATEYVAGSIAAVGGDVYVLDTRDTFQPGEFHTRLWRLAAGASQPGIVIDLPGPIGSNGPLWSHGGHVLFNAFAPAGDTFESVLYASDGTTAGTRRLYPPAGQSGTSNDVYPVEGGVVLPGYGANDTRIDLPSGAVSSVDSGEFDYGVSALLDGVRIGLGQPYAGDREVWITSGAQGGTRLLNDVWAGTAGGLDVGGSWAAIGDTLYFTHAYVVDNGYMDHTLWRSDGGEAGTVMLPRNQYQDRSVGKVLRYGDSGVLFTSTHWYSHLYYADAALSSAVVAVPNVIGEFLQSTDNGTGAIYPCSGVSALCGIHPGSGGSILAEGSFGSAVPIGQLGTVAVFGRVDGASEIWRSDGTPSGTYRLLADRRLAASPGAANFELSGKLYFVTCTASYVCDLTVTDGTIAGTTQLLPAASTGVSAAAAAAGRLVMSMGYSWDAQLWSTDGTVAGTRLLRSGGGSQFASTGDVVQMTFQCSGCKQTRLVTDGTPAGTRLVDLPLNLRSEGRFAAALDPNSVVFSCANTGRGQELCLSNAAGDEIVVLPEIFPGSYDADPVLIGRTASAVYFSADDGEHGRELWQLRLLTDAVFADGFQ